MNIAYFCHSLLSDWNHGNAHFLRGIARELKLRGHEVRIFEPADGWSLRNLRAKYGDQAIADFYRAYPGLDSIRYRLNKTDFAALLDNTDLVIVHEWNDPALVRRIGKLRSRGKRYRLLFHDTHHRAVTEPDSMSACDFSHYDGVLAYGKAIARVYRARGWAKRAWVWHEAADIRTFHPVKGAAKQGDLVWIGNWGDDERTAELHEFLIEPIKALGLKARVYGVRYPAKALRALATAGIEYGGWLPNFRVPEMFSRFRVTVHVHRRPYVKALPGIPTIRPFEALACGIPLICSPWRDVERLFTPSSDYLIAKNGEAMKNSLRAVLSDKKLAHTLAAHGRATILRRHTCAHRVDELLTIYQSLTGRRSGAAAAHGPAIAAHGGRQ